MSERPAKGKGPFALLDRVVDPAVRLGLGAPPPIPFGWWSGLVVMEIPGRRSGRIYRIPALALARRDRLIVSTVRERSQWMRNLAAAPRVHVWLRGQRRSARPLVWGRMAPREIHPLDDRIAFRNLGIWCEALGIRGALLVTEG